MTKRIVFINNWNFVALAFLFDCHAPCSLCNFVDITFSHISPANTPGHLSGVDNCVFKCYATVISVMCSVTVFVKCYFYSGFLLLPSHNRLSKTFQTSYCFWLQLVRMNMNSLTVSSISICQKSMPRMSKSVC